MPISNHHTLLYLISNVTGAIYIKIRVSQHRLISDQSEKHVSHLFTNSHFSPTFWMDLAFNINQYIYNLMQASTTHIQSLNFLQYFHNQITNQTANLLFLALIHLTSYLIISSIFYNQIQNSINHIKI